MNITIHEKLRSGARTWSISDPRRAAVIFAAAWKYRRACRVLDADGEVLGEVYKADKGTFQTDTGRPFQWTWYADGNSAFGQAVDIDA